MPFVHTTGQDGLSQEGRAWLVRIGVVFLLLTLIMYVIAVAPGVPYNVQELFGTRPPPWRAALFAVVALIALTPPAYLGLQLIRVPLRWVWVFPVGIIVHGLIVFLGYRFATPIGSLHDIVGQPSGMLPAEIERWVRFMGLFLMVSIPLAGGPGLLFAVTRSPVPARFLSWLGFAAVGLVVSWWIVVVGAATDNMTILLRDKHGLLSLLFLEAWVFVLSFAAALFAQRVSQVVAGSLSTVFGVLLCLPLSYWALMLALAPYIGGADHGLSPMGFLMSPSRLDYPSGEGLLLRYLVAYLAAVLLLALCQYPVWRRYVARPSAVGRPAESAIAKPLAGD